MGGPARDIPALIAFIDSRQRTPHAWGRRENDCVSFCLGAVAALTGVTVAPELDWNSEASAYRVIKRFGSLEAAFDAYFERVAPAFAMRGDIGLAPPVLVRSGPAPASADPFSLHPMIVEGPFLVGPGDKGNGRAPRSAMVAAWSATALKMPADG